MNKQTTPPKPPKPPENRMSCSACGYTAPESEFYERHKCYSKYVMLTILAIIPLSWIVTGVIKLLEVYNGV